MEEAIVSPLRPDSRSGFHCPSSIVRGAGRERREDRIPSVETVHLQKPIGSCSLPGMRLSAATFVVLAALLAGCGGSSKSSAKDPASSPSASAGQHQTVKWAKVPSSKSCPPGRWCGFEIQYGVAYNE